MLSPDGVQVTLSYIDSDEPLPEYRSDQIEDIDFTQSNLICAQSDREFTVTVDIPASFAQATGVKIVIAIGHRPGKLFCLDDVQAWYFAIKQLPRRWIFSKMRTWEHGVPGRETRLPLKIPQPANDQERADADDHWDDEFFANKGSIAVFVQCGHLHNEEIEDRLIYETDPPPSNRAEAFETPEVIRYEWFEPARGRKGKLYSFEFLNIGTDTDISTLIPAAGIFLPSLQDSEKYGRGKRIRMLSSNGEASHGVMHFDFFPRTNPEESDEAELTDSDESDEKSSDLELRDESSDEEDVDMDLDLDSEEDYGDDIRVHHKRGSQKRNEQGGKKEGSKATKHRSISQARQRICPQPSQNDISSCCAPSEENDDELDAVADGDESHTVAHSAMLPTASQRATAATEATEGVKIPDTKRTTKHDLSVAATDPQTEQAAKTRTAESIFLSSPEKLIVAPSEERAALNDLTPLNEEDTEMDDQEDPEYVKIQLDILDKELAYARMKGRFYLINKRNQVRQGQSNRAIEEQ